MENPGSSSSHSCNVSARRAGRVQVTVAVFSLTLFLSAAIMFSLQPLVGKMLLPLVGGTPAGWVVAMAFFQIMLLAGYLAAHLFSTLTPARHGLLYLLGLLVGTSVLPLSLSGHKLLSTTPGALDIFFLLTCAVALPFVALSATSSTIQRLFTETGHAVARDPYFLYVASNLGSFTGLLLYPVVIEPGFTLDQQTRGMFAAYLLLILLAALCLALARFTGRGREKGTENTHPARTPAALLRGKQRLEWLLLSFLPSSLLLGVTTHILTDVISAPLIWILPLALYLLTFVIAFARKPLVPLSWLEFLHPYVVFLAIVLCWLMRTTWLEGWAGVPFYLAVFTLIALTCHLRLASLRPLGDSRHLTEFYLLMSVGGALGGVLNAFIIPNVLNRAVEFPLMLLASLLLHPGFAAKSRTGIAGLILFALALLMINATPHNFGMDSARLQRVLSSAVLLLAILSPFRPSLLKPTSLMTGATALFMISQFLIVDNTVLLNVRDFYGTIAVSQTKTAEGYQLRSMWHGSTLHGMQVLDPLLEKSPTAYHARIGPLGDLFRAFHPRRVAILGLGVGAMNCYNAPDREFTFFEIDPAVVDVAKNQFTFLSKCLSRKPPRLLVGDGRLELAKLEGEEFDMIAMDAFTSDSIPTHLITREAFALYLQHLAPKGVLVINVSNRYFKLWSTVAATSGTLGLRSKIGVDLSPDRPFYSRASLWMVVTRPDVRLDALTKPRWSAVVPSPDIRPWTDNYTNLLRTLVFTGVRR